MSNVHLSSEPQASESDIQQVENAVNEFNMRLMDDWDYRPIRIFLRDDEGHIQGGIIGGIWGGWFHIIFFWVDEPLRKHGYGSQLVQAAEAEAQSHGCTKAFRLQISTSDMVMKFSPNCPTIRLLTRCIL